MLQLVDKQLEASQCVDCHHEAGERSFIFREFTTGVYHGRLCPACADKRTLAAMAKVESGEPIEFGGLGFFERRFICGEHGVVAVMANWFGTLLFPIVYTRVSRKRTTLHFLTADGRTWQAGMSHPTPDRYKFLYSFDFARTGWGKRTQHLNNASYILRPA